MTNCTSLKLLHYSCAKQTQANIKKVGRTQLRFEPLSTEGKIQDQNLTKSCAKTKYQHFTQDNKIQRLHNITLTMSRIQSEITGWVKTKQEYMINSQKTR